LASPAELTTKLVDSDGHFEDITGTAEMVDDFAMLALVCDWLTVDVNGLLATNRITFFVSGAGVILDVVPVNVTGIKLAFSVGAADSITVAGVPACN